MAQFETSVPPMMSRPSRPSSIETSVPEIPTDDVSPTATDTSAQNSQTCTPTISNLEESDDEVQFIFSAPRRKKKRRKRLESSQLFMGSFLKSNAQEEKPPLANLPLPRRGTTGMAQQLGSSHSEKPSSSSMRGRSLPSLILLNTASNLPRSASFVQQDYSKLFPVMPCIGHPGMPMSSVTLASRNPASIPPEVVVSNKRKRSLHEDPEPRRQSPAQRHTEPHCRQSSLSASNGQDHGPSEGLQEVTPSTCHTISSPDLSSQPFSYNPYSHIDPALLQSPAPSAPPVRRIPLESNIKNRQQPSWRHPASEQQFSSDPSQKMTITVPARLVPDQSVSPRTQTVEIPRTSFATRAQAQQMMMVPQRTLVSSIHPPLRQTARSSGESSTNKQAQTPRSLPPQAIFAVGPRKPQSRSAGASQPPQTYPSDIVRRPSLYKIPPWPSPPSPPSFNKRTSSSTRPPPSNSNCKLDMARSGFGASPNLGSQNVNMIRAQPGTGYNMQNGRPMQGIMPVTPPRTPPHQSQPRSIPPFSPAPAQFLQHPNKCKHTPNLIVDIAETCQSSFPFAAVAERHNTPIQKVFDTFSAIIQIPLLRATTDNRRHGSLGKQRMKEFRDAKKAMEMEMKESFEKPAPARVKKQKKALEQPLLRAAIMNNASRKD